jgi:hypothetical protein
MVEGPERSPKSGSPASLLAGVERAKRLIIAFVFVVVLALAFFFGVFSPEIACQAPKPPNSLKQKKIELAC